MRFQIKREGPIFKGPETVVRRNLDAAMSEIAAFGEAKIKRATPRGATNILVNSIFGEVRRAPRPVVVWGSPVLYAPVVERGRRPGRMPPPDALRDWVEKKLFVPREKSRGVAFLIARAIGRRGTKPRKMFEKSVSAIRRFSLKTLGLAMKKIADDLNQ